MLKVFHTQAMKLAIRQSIGLVILTTLSMAGLYWALTQFVDAQMSTDLKYSGDKFNKIYQTQGPQGLIKTLNKLNQTPGRLEAQRYYLLVNYQHKILAGNLKGWPEDFFTFNQVKNIWLDDDLLPAKVADHDGYWPTLALKFANGDQLLITQSVRETEQLREFTLTLMIFLVLGVAFISLYLGWRHGLNILQKIIPINETARQVEQGHLSSRVAISNKQSHQDEFEEMALHLNKMLDTIEKLMIDMRQVTQNIAHDLRKPLTRINTQLEVMEDKPPTPQQMIHLKTEVNQLIKTFNALLQLGQLESGVQPVQLKNINLSELIESLANLYAEMAQEKNLNWQADITSNTWVKGDRALLAQMLINIFENALKYTPKQGEIILKLALSSNTITLNLINSLAEQTTLFKEDLQQITQPFVRLETERSTPGNGLGLPLVKAIALWHHGKLTIQKTTFPNQKFTQGFNLCITLPIT